MLKIRSLYIENFKAFKQFKMEFNDSLTVIVGQNGTGKTTIMEVIFNMLSGNIEYFNNYLDFSYIECEIKIDDILDRLKYQKTNNQIEIFLNDKVISQEEFKNKYKIIYLPTESTFENKKLEGIKKLEDKEDSIILDSKTMGDELKQFLLNQYFMDLSDFKNGEEKNAIRIDNFKRLYNNFFEDKEFVKINVENFEPIFRLKENGKEILIEDLSAGEKQIFFRGGSLLQNIKDNTIVLIDEPEISLHPEWQQKILDFYKNINNDNQFIFATHSPQIVSCCKREEIIVLIKEQDKIIKKENIKETYGLPNEQMLLSIFNVSTVRNQKLQELLNEYRSLYAKQELATAQELKRLAELKEKIKQEANPNDIEVQLMESKINTEKLNEILNKYKK